MIRKLLPYLRPHRLTFGIVLGLLAVVILLELLKPWPLKFIIDGVLTPAASGAAASEGSAASWLLLACVGLVAVHALAGTATVLHNYTSIRLGQQLVRALRSDLYQHLQRLSLAFHSHRQVGDLLYRVTADTYAIQAMTMNGLFPLISALALMLGMAWVMTGMDRTLTLIALGVCPVLLALIAHLNSRIGRAATDAKQKESRVYAVVQQSLSAIRLVQAFTKEEEEHRSFMTASGRSLDASLRLYTLQTVYSGIVGVVVAGGTAAAVWVGAQHVLQGSLTIGGLVVFTSYLASLYAPINQLVQCNRTIQESGAAVRRVFEILTVERDVPDGPVPLPRAIGGIRFDRVSFGYTPNGLVLREVSLTVTPGQRIAIVGPTGAGKSTLVGLIPRFFDPLEGHVLIDGRDARDYRLADLRRAISLVLQPPLIFPITLRENIAYGRPEAGLDEIIAAARQARIHDMIEKLPQGYDTVVGEQGATLSEGEKQRLTIARAIVRDAPILILDEPTSSVDVETEALIMDALNQLMIGRTTLMIAHRLSTVRTADVIVVLRNGQIVEIGSWEELMARDGYFAALHRRQWPEGGRSVSLVEGAAS
ncbi:MAG TPA: ABC transporter ATP-binding protein [Nitrospirales bacterium]|nr:ABC transporter ATP-binding protein [Nitrospirales bacterium]